MQKLLALLACSVVLVSCGSKDGSEGAASASSSSAVSAASTDANPNNGDKVADTGETVVVHYVGTLDDGSEFDSSRKDGKQPLSFTLGKQEVIPGFDAGVKGMKIGDKKKIRIEPKDAYGEAMTTREFPKTAFEDVMTGTVEVAQLVGKMTRQVPKAQAAQVFSKVEKGEKFVQEGETVIITEINGDTVTIEIDDKNAPFYGKEVKAGAKGMIKQGGEIRITKVEGTVASYEADNTLSAFYKKKLEVGAKGTDGRFGEVEIAEIKEGSVMVKVKNTHPLANKALNFEIELLEIK